MIGLHNIKKKYGDLVALDIPELHISKGERLGLVGNNGAGKTTMISLILDLIRATEGYATIEEEVSSKSENWKTFTGSYLDENALIDYLTPNEYFEFVGRLNGWSKDDVYSFLERFTEFFNDELIDKKKYIRDLSKGNQKKLGIASALIGDPDVVILDEPFANLDPTSQIRLKDILKSYTQEITLLVSSHDLNHITEVCSRIVVLEQGKVARDLKTDQSTLKELESYFSVT